MQFNNCVSWFLAHDSPQFIQTKPFIAIFFLEFVWHTKHARINLMHYFVENWSVAIWDYLVVCSTVTAQHFFSWRLEVRASVIYNQGMHGECFQDERRETIWGILLYHSQLACRLLPNAGYCLPSWSTGEHCSTMLFSAPWQDDYNVKSCCVTSMPGVPCSSSACITLGTREWWREGLELLRFSNSRSA